MEKRNVELSIEKAMEWYKKGGELKEVALQAYKEEELKSLTYEDVCKELFLYKKTYYINSNGDIEYCISHSCNMLAPNSSTSARQLEKLSAINKLVNVAKYLNGSWEPNWNNTNEHKYSISQDNTGNIFVENNIYRSNSEVVFKTYDLAKEAIKILGEGTIRLITNGKW